MRKRQESNKATKRYTLCEALTRHQPPNQLAESDLSDRIQIDRTAKQNLSHALSTAGRRLPGRSDIEINSDGFIPAGSYSVTLSRNWLNQREVLTPQSIVAPIGFYARPKFSPLMYPVSMASTYAVIDRCIDKFLMRSAIDKLCAFGEPVRFGIA
jgi:hypothetical protein